MNVHSIDKRKTLISSILMNVHLDKRKTLISSILMNVHVDKRKKLISERSSVYWI